MNTENHYQETDLGNIAPNPRGEYNPEESYEYLDLVVFEGGSYICLTDATITGIYPESGKTTQYWQVITIPGDMTPEYIAMHDRVVNLSEQVEADAEEVRTAEQNVSGMELNVTEMQEYTRQSAESAEQSKDSAAGYAASADASRRAAEESEQNINAQVTGFDAHVAEKTSEAENDIEAARINANKAVLEQQVQSVNEVARVGGAAVSTAQAAAQASTEKASSAAISEQNTKASETAAKESETNVAQMAEQVATDKEQVANDRTAVEKAKQEMTESVAQIEQNTQGISELKGDLVNQKYKSDWFFGTNIEWETGGIKPQTGENVDNATRSRTVNKYFIQKGVTITSNANIYIIKYGDTVTYEGWVKSWTADSDCNIRIMLNSVNDADIKAVKVDYHNEKMNRDEMESSFDYIGKSNELLHRFDESATKNGAGVNRWFLKSEVIEPKTYVKSIQFEQIKMINSTVGTVEVWVYSYDKSKLTKVKSVPFNTVGEGASVTITVDIDYLTDSYTIIAIVTPVAMMYVNKATKNDRDARYKVSGDVSDISQIDKSDMTTVNYKIRAIISVYNTIDKINDIVSVDDKYNIVKIGKYCKYTTIQEALDDITDDTADNPYLFEIMPGTYPYFVMTNQGRVRYISMIGKCKHDCIIRDDSGQYYNAPALVYTNGMFKNLTFLATHDNPPEEPENAKHKSYALHMDCGTQDVLFEDCVFTSYQAPAVGIGCYQDVRYHFKNCEMYSYAPEWDGVDHQTDYGTNFSYLAKYGGLFCHSNTANGKTNQRIILDNCRIYSENGTRGLWITIAGDFVDSEMLVTCINTMALNGKDGVKAAIHPSLTITPDSYGNNW